MKTCPNCGNQVADDAAFCNNCGVAMPAPVKEQTTEQNVQQNPQPQVNQQSNAGPQPNPQQNFQQAPYQQVYQPYDPSDHSKEFDPKDVEDNKMFAVAAYLLGMVGIVIALLANTPYTRFHAKNSLKLEIAGILSMVLLIIPFLGIVAFVICVVIIAVLKIIAIVWAFIGKSKDLPIINSISFMK